MDNKTAYGADARETCALFADHLDGDPDRPFVVLSYAGPGDAARDAIEKSLAARGYGDASSTAGAQDGGRCSYVTVMAAQSDIALDDQALFLLIEALDPLGIICTDAQATSLLGRAYREDYELDAAVRVFGRSSVAFEDLDSLISDEAGKRRAWELFKSLR